MSNNNLKYLKDTVEYVTCCDGKEETVEYEMKDWPDDVLVRLDRLYGELDKGINLCQEIMKRVEKGEIEERLCDEVDWLEERLVKCFGVLSSVVYEMGWGKIAREE